MSESYDSAEATLEELVPSLDASKDHVTYLTFRGSHFLIAFPFFLQASSEYQELRWLRLAILKKRKAGDAAILDG